MNQQQKRVLIIGAGPSGLSLLRALQKQNSTQSIQIVCCQKQAEWGGQWNYITRQKVDKNGIPIPSTNEYLWTNAPKECFQYPDYSFDRHFKGFPMPSYLPRQYLKDYFTKRFQESNIKQYIRFQTVAKDIHYIESKGKFSVQIQNLSTKHKTLDQFDYVVVASGHYSSPNIPDVEGLKSFQGKLLHSVEVKDYLDYQNQNILVVGTGLSAEDAVLQCYKYGAKSISVTYRTRPMSQKFPQQISQFPLLTKVQGRTVTFKNGQQKDFDTIILCTGYMHNFSFLEPALQLKSMSSLWAQDLYMGVVFQNNPRLMYIGTQAQYFSFMMFDIQSHLARDVMLQRIKLPPISQMKEEGQEKMRVQRQIQNPYDAINFMGNYMKDLIKLCSYKDYQIQQVIGLYMQLQKHKEQNILTFRDNNYRSSVTGKWSIMKKQSWLQAGSKFQNSSEDPQLEQQQSLTQSKLNELTSITQNKDRVQTNLIQV